MPGPRLYADWIGGVAGPKRRVVVQAHVAMRLIFDKGLNISHPIIFSRDAPRRRASLFTYLQTIERVLVDVLLRWRRRLRPCHWHRLLAGFTCPRAVFVMRGKLAQDLSTRARKKQWWRLIYRRLDINNTTDL